MHFGLRSSAGMIVLLSVAAFAEGQGIDPEQEAKPATGGSESLGGQLLNELGAGPPRAVQPPPKAEPANPALPKRPPAKFDDLGDDLGAPNGPLPLVRARQSMSQAHALLAQPGNIAEARVEQQRAVAQLDELINTLSKQCQGGNCSPSDKPPQPGQRSQPKPAAKAGTKPGTSAIGPRDATADLKQPDVRAAEKADRDEIVKRLWGQLPERSREQMLQSFSGEFLPKYELELEKYYRRLAEEQEKH
ncbi:MAG: hypothetical protein WD669_03015 [Pirellulales bacterium]